VRDNSSRGFGVVLVWVGRGWERGGGSRQAAKKGNPGTGKRSKRGGMAGNQRD